MIWASHSKPVSVPSASSGETRTPAARHPTSSPATLTVVMELRSSRIRSTSVVAETGHVIGDAYALSLVLKHRTDRWVHRRADLRIIVLIVHASSLTQRAIGSVDTAPPLLPPIHSVGPPDRNAMVALRLEVAHP